MLTARTTGLSAIVVAALCSSATAAPFCAVFPFGTQCLYYDVTRCQQAAGPGGLCTDNPSERGGAANIGTSLNAGAQFSRDLRDAEHKTKVYSALRNQYGAAVAGDPDAALKAQEYQLREQTNAIAIQQAQANLLAQEQRNARTALDLDARKAPQTKPCSEEDAELARWAKQNGYQHRSACN